jgi:hypothetical protein
MVKTEQKAPLYPEKEFTYTDDIVRAATQLAAESLPVQGKE